METLERHSTKHRDVSALLLESQMNVLTDIVELIVNRVNPVCIYCFGYRIRASARMSVFCEDLSHSVCELDLLIIGEGIECKSHQLLGYLNANTNGVKLNILCHCPGAVETAVKIDNPFFSRVAKDGLLIHGALDIDSLEQGEPTEINELVIFEANRKKAVGFLICAQELFLKEDYPLSVFMLHQATEQALIGLILSVTGYRTNYHSIKRLISLCDNFTEAVSALMLGTSEEDTRLLNKLFDSYSKARYQSDFSVSKYDAWALQQKIEALLDLTTSLTQQKHTAYETK
jgi:uncharacterized protein